jgi:anti-anti-sigma factor
MGWSVKGGLMLRIEIQHSGNTAILRCSGRIVQGDGVELLKRTAMSRAEKHLILDLAEVTSIDAGGLGVLVGLQRAASDSGRTLRLLNPSKTVRDVIAATNLQSVLQVITEAGMWASTRVAAGLGDLQTIPAADI